MKFEIHHHNEGSEEAARALPKILEGITKIVAQLRYLVTLGEQARESNRRQEDVLEENRLMLKELLRRTPIPPPKATAFSVTMTRVPREEP